MDHETNILPQVQNAPADIDTAPEAGTTVTDAAISAAVPDENTADAAPSVNSPEEISSLSGAEEAPAVPAESSKEDSFVLDSEISSLLGEEVSAILAADWASSHSRTVPERTVLPVTQEPENAAEPTHTETAEEAVNDKKKKTKADKAPKTEAPKESSAPKKKRSLGRKIFCFVRRALLLILVIALLAVAAAAMACHAIFNGPSQDAKQMLYSTFMEPSGTKWIPGLFLSDEEIQALENPSNPLPPTADISGEIIINTDTDMSGENDEWKDHPDGIRIEHIVGDSYTAHVMIIRDPSRVYLGTSRSDFTVEYPGSRLDYMMERDNAVAGINGGAFWDNGTRDPKVGMYPEGLVIAGGEVRWNSKDTSFPDNGFVGFNYDNVLVVAKSMTAKQAKELGIRDGVVFGPVLIVDGKGNAEVYNNKAGGQNPRTCIGQRADGAVIFLCIDGRQANSLGGTYADCIDILTEYGAVNACNLDGGSSSTMFYRDVYGKYEEKGSVFMVNNYSLLQSQPRRMPTFFLVAPEKEGE